MANDTCYPDTTEAAAQAVFVEGLALAMLAVVNDYAQARDLAKVGALESLSDVLCREARQLTRKIEHIGEVENV